eukprot:15433034-Alexandrium_andersonii.AAC.1
MVLELACSTQGRLRAQGSAGEGSRSPAGCAGVGLRPGHHHAADMRSVFQQLYEDTQSVDRQRRATRMDEIERSQLEQAIRASEGTESASPPPAPRLPPPRPPPA